MSSDRSCRKTLRSPALQRCGAPRETVRAFPESAEIERDRKLDCRAWEFHACPQIGVVAKRFAVQRFSDAVRRVKQFVHSQNQLKLSAIENWIAGLGSFMHVLRSELSQNASQSSASAMRCAA